MQFTLSSVDVSETLFWIQKNATQEHQARR